ncbi:MAG: PqqD family peptide modification chaperone [Leptospirales bacterium]|nr:PqqD family peptide modification chaperone [Leptospirales bacterium]MCL2155512.1 PqqD family peptide modification chaperone [Leptospirales bacterium]
MCKLENLKYKFNHGLIIRTIKDTTLAYNQENGDMYEFNDVGAEILYLLKEEIEISQIFITLCDGYNVTIEEIYDDVSELVNRMLSLNIIESLSIPNVEMQELMTESVGQKVLGIIREILDDSAYSHITLETELASLDIDSISYIRLVIALEEAFNFEFDDVMLLINNFSNIKSIAEYISSRS